MSDENRQTQSCSMSDIVNRQDAEGSSEYEERVCYRSSSFERTRSLRSTVSASMRRADPRGFERRDDVRRMTHRGSERKDAGECESLRDDERVRRTRATSSERFL